MSEDEPVTPPDMKLDPEVTPEARKRVPNPQGIPVVLGDGNEWVLAYGCLSPNLLPQIDSIYDQVILTQYTVMEPILIVAWHCLIANYNLANFEAAALIQGAEEKALVEGVIGSLFGVSPPRVTYSTWALCTLYMNGLDPGELPTWLIPMILGELVATGRARSQNEVIDSAVASAARSDLMNQLQRAGVKRRDLPTNPNQPQPRERPGNGQAAGTDKAED